MHVRKSCMQRANVNYHNGKFTAHFISAAMKIQFQNNFPFYPCSQLFHCPWPRCRPSETERILQTIFQRNSPCHMKFSFKSFNLSKNSACETSREHYIPQIECVFVAETLISFCGWHTQCEDWKFYSKNILFEKCRSRYAMHTATAENAIEWNETKRKKKNSSPPWPVATCAVRPVSDEHISNGFSTVLISSGVGEFKLNQYFVCLSDLAWVIL